MAGVAELLAKEMGKGNVVLQVKSLDNFGFGRHYRNTQYYLDYQTVIDVAHIVENQFDKIVIHDFNEFVGEFPKEKTFIYFHGSKLRGLGEEKIKEVQSRVSGVFLSTPDLLSFCSGKVIPQPIDLSMFYNMELPRTEECVSIQREYQYNEISDMINQDFPECQVIDRVKNYRSYREMPIYLNTIENYVDYKYDFSNPPKPVKVPSCTGLQALACGCRVYGHDKQVLPISLLKDHDSRNIARVFESCLEV